MLFIVLLFNILICQSALSERYTTFNELEQKIIDWDMENGIVAVEGSVPGGRGSLVRIYPQNELPADIEDPTSKVEETKEEVKAVEETKEEDGGENKDGN